MKLKLHWVFFAIISFGVSKFLFKNFHFPPAAMSCNKFCSVPWALVPLFSCRKSAPKVVFPVTIHTFAKILNPLIPCSPREYCIPLIGPLWIFQPISDLYFQRLRSTKTQKNTSRTWCWKVEEWNHFANFNKRLSLRTSIDRLQNGWKLTSYH